MLFKRGNIWWTQFKHQGQRHRISTGCTDFKAATIEARRIRVKLDEERGPGGSAPGVTLAVLEELHVQRCRQKGLGDRRVETIENLWANLERHLGEFREVSDLKSQDVAEYEGKRRAETYRGEHIRGQTIRREVQALRLGLKLAKRNGLIERYPFDWDDLDNIESDSPSVRQEAKARTIDEIERVLAKLSVKAKTAGHVEILRLILATGLRMEEFRRCNESWVREAPKESGAAALLVVPADCSKTGTPRTIPLEQSSVETIQGWALTFPKKDLNKSLWLASSLAGVSPPITPRDLRATYLTAVATCDPLAAQKLGGHSNLATTGLYLDAEIARTMRAGIRAAKTLSRGPQSRGHSKKGQSKETRNRPTRARSSFG